MTGSCEADPLNISYTTSYKASSHKLEMWIVKLHSHLTLRRSLGIVTNQRNEIDILMLQK